KRLKQKTSEAYAKDMHKKFSKGKFLESDKIVTSEAHIPGFDIPLNTVLPETQHINVSSSTSPDTAELDQEAETIFKEGVTKFGEYLILMQWLSIFLKISKCQTSHFLKFI
ncbi:hypothetical protein A2U01_0055380, partial [Trifolium medium]|nr:hypothetical protein [Trifolium medium]